jgi:DNA mismatch repair protein MutS
MEGVVNYNVAAKKHGDSITFLRKIVRGATDDSYGIEVAKLAGVPNEVVRRARQILDSIEAGTAIEVKAPRRAVQEPSIPAMPDMLSSLADQEAREAAEKIRAVDLNTMTHIEAMNFVFELKKIVSTDPSK